MALPVTVSELAAKYVGRDQVTIDWPKMLDEVTGGTLKRIVDVWPIGSDLVVAHLEVAMSVEGVDHAGSAVTVCRVADGRVVEVFDIPSASI